MVLLVTFRSKVEGLSSWRELRYVHWMRSEGRRTGGLGVMLSSLNGPLSVSVWLKIFFVEGASILVGRRE